MTGFALWLLGLAATGLVYQPYQGFEPILNQIEEQQKLLQDEQERNYLAEQEEIIIEDYFLFLNKIKKIKYARGCMWEYTPPKRSEEKQKRVKCSNNAFDCAWLIKAYWIAKGIITSKEAVHLNSQTLMDLTTEKDGRLAKRWDRTIWKGYGERSTGNLSTHFAIVSRDYSGGNILWVYDNVNWNDNNIIWERPLKVAYVHYDNTFRYLGKYYIKIYTNWFVDVARKKWINVERWIDTEEKEILMSQVDPLNPAGYSVIISWFAYDSLVNRIASYRYDTNQDIDMIATFMQESMFNHLAVWPYGERWLCQLIPNKTNNVWIRDIRFSDPMYQAEICLKKRELVSQQNKWIIWAWYKYRHKHKKNIILLNK